MWRMQKKDVGPRFMFELAPTANEGLSWRVHVASWLLYLALGEEPYSQSQCLVRGSDRFGAHAKAFFRYKNLGSEDFVQLHVCEVHVMAKMWWPRVHKIPVGLLRSFIIIIKCMVSGHILCVCVWQSSVCASWILDLGGGGHIDYLDLTSYSKWENFDWKFCIAAFRAYGLERFFGWWQVCSVWYRNKRKERSLWLRHGMWKKRAKAVLSCMAALRLNCTNGVQANSANPKLEVSCDSLDVSEEEHPVYQMWSNVYAWITWRLRNLTQESLRIPTGCRTFRLTVTKLSNLSPNIGQRILFLKHV